MIHLTLSYEESHWLRYALLITAGAEEMQDSPERKVFIDILWKLSEAERSAIETSPDESQSDT